MVVSTEFENRRCWEKGKVREYTSSTPHVVEVELDLTISYIPGT